MTDLEHRAWDLTSYHPSAFDAQVSTDLLRKATDDNLSAIANTDLAAKVRAFESYHQIAMPLIGIEDVLRETDDSAKAKAYLRDIDAPLHGARVSALALRKSLAETVRVGGVPEQLLAFSPVLTNLARMPMPASESLPWAALGEDYGFEVLGHSHRKLLQTVMNGTVRSRGAEIAITFQNWSALLSHEDPDVRKSVWALRVELARKYRSCLESMKWGRLRFIQERAKLLGQPSLLEAQLSNWRLDPRVLETLRGSDERTPADDPTWVLQTHAEQIPYFGYGFASAFTLAYILYLSGSPERTLDLGRGLAWQPIDTAARSILGVDLAAAETINRVFGHLEVVMGNLE